MHFFDKQVGKKRTLIKLISVIILISSCNFSYSADKIKVASIFAKSGIAAAGNLTAIVGIRFAIQEINRNGGILGKEVEIIEYDNQSTPLHSKKAAEEAVQEGVSAVLGANWSSHSQAMAAVLQEANIPMLAVFSTNPDVTRVGDYIFRVCFIDSFQGRIMANFAIQNLKARKAAIMVNSSSRYSEGLASYFREHFVAAGGQIVIEENYLQDEESFSPYLEKIIPVKPDVIFVPGHIVDSGRIIKQARDIGLTVPILGGDGWATSMYDHAGSALDGNYFSGHWHEKNTTEKSREFVNNYSESSEIPMDGGTALAYDAVYLFANAVRNAGSFTPSKIRDALAATHEFIGVTGSITFDEFGDPVKPGIITKFDKGSILYVQSVTP